MASDLGAARPLCWSEPGRTTLEIKTGGWRTRRPVYVEAVAPCQAACPAAEPVATWIERARGGDPGGAWALIREQNPFPAVMGRVCAHPCESACNRGRYDGSVSINALERFIGDWGLRHGRPPSPRPWRSGRVAVVGGGPAGISCAYHLSRLGYGVQLFEAQPALGGLLRYGIPEYRLPRAVLDREIDLALGPGVEVLTGRRLGANLTWVSCREHDAVFVATGAPLPLRLGVPGEEARGIGDGLGFLESAATGAPPPLGPRLVVVGGGSTAMDVARSARRLGTASVTVLALERREEMPALPEEVAQAVAEGVVIRNGVGVPVFVEVGGRLTGVAIAPGRAERCPDGSIRPILGGEWRRVIDCDSVLLAIGQRPDPAGLPRELAVAGGLVGTDPRGATSAARVFAGGDAASRERTVPHAVGAGTRAARAIHAALSGEAVAAAPRPRAGAVARPGHVVGFHEVNAAYFSPSVRAERPERTPALRIQSFVEVVEGLDPARAQAETRRCFTCGRCTGCDNCFVYCPDMAVARADGGYRIVTDHCKGCGVCVEECPRGALEMAGEP